MEDVAVRDAVMERAVPETAPAPAASPARTYALYTPVLRSSHLERLAPEPGLRLLAAGRHPDCDDALLATTALPVLLGDLSELAADLRADPPDVLEVTEPLWVAEWPASLRLAGAAPAARLVTYAIEVLPSTSAPPPGRLAAVAYGSAAAARAYDASYPDAGWASTVAEERRGRCLPCFGRPAAAAPAAPATPEVVFAAEFSERKAVDLLMTAWEQQSESGWRLRLLGWGPRTERVLAWARDREDVDVVVGAGRAAVHDGMRRAAVVVLPSVRVPGWREQIGLSLVEGLAHGCHLLTSDETGLAEGLRAAGHTVVPAGDAAALRRGLQAAMQAAQPLLRHGKTLPEAGQDSRQRAQRWLAGAGPSA